MGKGLDNGVIKAITCRDFVELMCKKIVNHPDKVVVNEVVGGSMCILEVETHENDAAIVIGKRGRTINAMRTLLAAVSGANKGVGSRKYVVEVMEDNRR